jgi:hypothetical protein
VNASHPRSEPNYQQTSLRLDKDTYDMLVAAAKAHGLTIAEEMRRRLFTSLTSGPPREGDKPTRELIDAVKGMAANLEDWVGPWHEQPGAFRAFGAALLGWLRRYEPKGEPTLTPKAGAEAMFTRRGPTIENVARMLIALNTIPDEPSEEDKD